MTLPGFEPDEPKQVRPRSAKDDDDDLHVSWRKYAGAPRLCHKCISYQRSGLQLSIDSAKYIRAAPNSLGEVTERPYCMKHKQEQYERDQLEGLIA